MLKDIIGNIENNVDVRKNLIDLKLLLKEKDNRYALLYQLNNDFSLFENLLFHEEPKIRKNAAIILGKIGNESCLDVLYNAYKREQQRFVKGSYLMAIAEMDYQRILPDLRDDLIHVQEIVVDADNKKHLDEERKLLTELILSMDGMDKHQFIGWNVPSRLILITNRNFQALVAEKLSDYMPKVFNAGVMVGVDELKKVSNIRMVQEVLFQLNDIKTCSLEPSLAAKKLANSSLQSFLEDRHIGGTPFYFRIELKSKMERDKKSAFIKKMAGELERNSQQKFINSSSHYEFEIRFIENKEGTFNILIKLFTYQDERFSYRKNVLASSIAPYNASLIMELAKDYMQEDAQILDPFCGVGTMLIERHKFKKANTIYGLDLYGKAIEMARENTELAGVIAHYINRDFFDFRHEYLFDEIITNMPFLRGNTEERELEKVYCRFFVKAKEHLKSSGLIIMHSHNSYIIQKYFNKITVDYELLEKFEISRKEDMYLFIWRLREHSN